MTRRNKIYFILSLLVLLAPAVFGLAVKERLDVALGGVGVWLTILLPLILLALHFLCVGSMLYEKKKNGQSDKIVSLSIWLIPAISLAVSVAMYCAILTNRFVSFGWIYILLGILFILAGNYMPKAKRNRHFGIKTRATLSSDDIWARTHRFGGKVQVLVGILILPCVFLPEKPFILLTVVLAGAFSAALIPMVYAYVLYKKAIKDGVLTKENTKIKKADKIGLAISIPLIAAVLACVAIITFTGKISFSPSDSAIIVDASFWSDKEILYGDIEEISLVNESGVMRLSGFSSPRLSMGLYKSEGIGNHTRYAYNEGEKSVLLTLKNGSKIVLRCESEAETTALYEGILEKLS